jgi:hypothetical protein
LFILSDLSDLASDHSVHINICSDRPSSASIDIMDHHYYTPEELFKLADPDPEFAEVHSSTTHNPHSKICTKSKERCQQLTICQLIASTPQPKVELTLTVVNAIRQQSLIAEQTRTAEAIASRHNEQVLRISMRDGFLSEIRIHRPKTLSENGDSGGSLLVVLIHGGGFFMGKFEPSILTSPISINLTG